MHEYPLAVLRRNIGMVPQETFLFSETLRENLAFGAPGADGRRYAPAADAAHIRKEFEEFPQGFETMVGERGMTLSGGQKQRSAIARALLRRPAILILDDALASVDTYTEERILGGLRAYTETTTTSSSPIASRLCAMRIESRCSIAAASSKWARTMNCLPWTATTPASFKSNSWKKNSPWPAEKRQRRKPAPCPSFRVLRKKVGDPRDLTCGPTLQAIQLVAAIPSGAALSARLPANLPGAMG